MKHNNQLPNARFRKHWQKRVKTWFDQPAAKKRRHNARVEKAKRLAPRPADFLRPAVRCQTIKYNTRLRAGRGFTFDEIKAAGLTPSYARTVGISVDHRRRNRCEESLELNKQRLLAYVNRLVVIPSKKKGSSAAAPASLPAQVDLQKVMPITQDTTVEPARKITSEEASTSSFKALRDAWGIKRTAGARAKRAAAKASEAADAKK